MNFSIKITKLVAASALLFVAASAQAVEFEPTGGLGFDFGGDDLLHVSFTDGSDSTLRAGDGMLLYLGTVATLNEAETFLATITLGWKYSGIGQADNGDATISRFPLEGILYYRSGQHRFGVGATKHLSISYDTGGVLAGYGTTLESNIGTILEYGYSFDEDSPISFGIRYTNLTYHAPEYDVDVDASSTGVFMKFGI